MRKQCVLYGLAHHFLPEERRIQEDRTRTIALHRPQKTATSRVAVEPRFFGDNERRRILNVIDEDQRVRICRDAAASVRKTAHVHNAARARDCSFGALACRNVDVVVVWLRAVGKHTTKLGDDGVDDGSVPCVKRIDEDALRPPVMYGQVRRERDVDAATSHNAVNVHVRRYRTPRAARRSRRDGGAFDAKVEYRLVARRSDVASAVLQKTTLRQHTDVQL
jgi:hypothetical protein